MDPGSETVLANNVVGRAMFATKQFKIGDIIFEERPFVSAQFSWNMKYKYLACENCLKPLETANENVRRLTGNKSITLPYPNCCPTTSISSLQKACPHCGIQYCSEDCRIDAAQRYHFAICLKSEQNNIEHPINKLTDEWRKIHYPPETTSITLITKLLGMFMQSQNKTELLEILKSFQDKVVNEDLMLSHKMLGPNFEEQLKMLYPYYCQAFASDETTMFLTPQAFKTFFAIIGTNGQGLGTSPFSEWVKNVSELDMAFDERAAVDSLIDDLYEKLDDVTGLQFLNNEGSALYVTQSKINHSCVPNAQATFPHSNHTLALTALRDINVGEEISISYLDECSLERSRHSRQKELKENYLFVCKCEKCEQQLADPDVTSDEEDENEDEIEEDMEN